MAGSFQGGGRNGGRLGSYGRRPGQFKQMSEINVTPFVDVMLVLLVVFMITAPLLSVGVKVDLPDAAASPLQGDKQPLTVSIDAEGKIYLQETEIPLDELAPKLKAISENDTNARIFVRGDQAIDYGRVMHVMGTINAAGFRKVALVTELPKATGKKRGKR
jgi:biopolymer transport protein TolR